MDLLCIEISYVAQNAIILLKWFVFNAFVAQRANYKIVPPNTVLDKAREAYSSGQNVYVPTQYVSISL